MCSGFRIFIIPTLFKKSKGDIVIAFVRLCGHLSVRYAARIVKKNFGPAPWGGVKRSNII